MDFRAALDAEVDVLAHVPGYQLQDGADPAVFTISEADARRAARQGLVVVTGPMRGVRELAETKPAHHRAAANLQRANIGVLRRAGVWIAAGSDTYLQTSTAEMAYFHWLGVMDNAALLRMWSEDTPRTIFPNRRIGRLVPGYEASLLVLNCDPLA